jgi:hypothetical protein
MERMTETFGATVGRALLESFYATASTEGLSVIFNRCAWRLPRLHAPPVPDLAAVLLKTCWPDF